MKRKKEMDYFEAVGDRPKRKMHKLPKLSTLKKKADSVYSEWVRRKDAVNDMVKCVSCGKVHHWKEMDAGHYFKRHKLGTRFHDDNVHPQCKACNIFKDGNYPDYADFMFRKYGQYFMDNLKQIADAPKKYTASDYLEMIEDFKSRIEHLNRRAA